MSLDVFYTKFRLIYASRAEWIPTIPLSKRSRLQLKTAVQAKQEVNRSHPQGEAAVSSTEYFLAAS